MTGKRKGYQSLRLSESFMCTDAIRSPEMLLSRSPQKSRNLENKFFKDECVCGGWGWEDWESGGKGNCGGDVT